MLVSIFSGKSQVPMLQLIHSIWVTHLQVWDTTGLLHECINMGPREFRLWIMSYEQRRQGIADRPDVSVLMQACRSL